MSSSTISPAHPDAPEPSIAPLDPSILTSILSTSPTFPSHDPTSTQTLPSSSSGSHQLPLPPVILGCATFGYGIYAPKEQVESPLPVQVVRAALKRGINAFDTAPHYHPSEIILGRALQALGSEFPRETYRILTKAGKYGPKRSWHDYRPETIRKSVERSLTRLGTDYLDVVYLHDVEFVASHPSPSPAGFPLDALKSSGTADLWGLHAPETSRGTGDDEILAALSALRALQSAGKIRQVGLAGYPLAQLLRLSLLALHTTGTPVDVVQTYAHQTLLNNSLEAGYLEALKEQAKVGTVINASPLAMGILTESLGPEWHPVRGESEMLEAVKEAIQLCRDGGTTLANTALHFGLKELQAADGQKVPCVIGCKDVEEVEKAVEAWHRTNTEKDEKGEEMVEKVVALFEQKKLRGWSWQSPPDDMLNA